MLLEDIYSPSPTPLPSPTLTHVLLWLHPDRLYDILHQDQKLYLVFEMMDMDLKKYMDTVGNSEGLGPLMVKVGQTSLAGEVELRGLS